MQEFNYMAEMAAMKIEFIVLRDNITIKWEGFDDGLSQFVVKSLEVLQSIRNKDFKDVFESQKEKMLQTQKNHYLQQTFRLAASYIDTVLMEGDWEEKKKRVITEDLTYEEFKQMQQNWLVSGRMVWFVYGNIQKDKVISTIDSAKAILNLKPVTRESLVDIRSMDILPQ